MSLGVSTCWCHVLLLASLVVPQLIGHLKKDLRSHTHTHTRWSSWFKGCQSRSISCALIQCTMIHFSFQLISINAVCLCASKLTPSCVPLLFPARNLSSTKGIPQCIWLRFHRRIHRKQHGSVGSESNTYCVMVIGWAAVHGEMEMPCGVKSPTAMQASDAMHLALQAGAEFHDAQVWLTSQGLLGSVEGKTPNMCVVKWRQVDRCRETSGYVRKCCTQPPKHQPNSDCDTPILYF